MLRALALVLLAGGMNGSFATPMKRVRGWEWEHTWLLWSFMGMIVIPLAIALASVSDLFAVYRAAGPAPLMLTAFYGMLWGTGAVLFGLGVIRVGIALGFGIILGTASLFGAVIPLIELHRDRLFSRLGILTLVGAAIVSVGVAACARAGVLRDASAPAKAQAGSFSVGLIICVLSGLGSTVMSVALNQAAPIYTAAESLGTSAAQSLNAVWPVLLAGGFAANAAYCGSLIIRGRSARRFGQSAAANLALVAAMAVLWSGSNFVYGAGARTLGSLGLVLGWPIFMAAIVLTANAWGWLTGEWRGAGRAPVAWAVAGNFLLIVGISAIASAGRS
jgi:L-rhamnose-H+ transport protein